MDLLENPWISKFLVELVVSLVLVLGGYLVGSYRERRSMKGRSLDEYDFYPYESTRENFAEFSLKDFRLGVHYFLRNRDARAARQLIFIGEQNDVRGQLDAAERAAYEKLYAKYDGKSIADDTLEFLENYRNIVRLIGRTFRNMGIEVLLHDLSNPTRSIAAIEGGDTTGTFARNGHDHAPHRPQAAPRTQPGQAQLRAQHRLHDASSARRSRSCARTTA